MSGYPLEVTPLLSPCRSYIPGYTGHCPGLKFTMGKTYGKLTAELSQRTRQPKSDISRLSENIPDHAFRKSIPGFTGFIPRSRNYFGCNYYQTCKKAQTEAYLAEQMKRQERSMCLPSVSTYGSEHLERAKFPVTAEWDEMLVYQSIQHFKTPRNPYLMENDNPKTFSIPGSTGHVPFAAPKDYGKHQNRLKADEKEPKHLPLFYSSKKGIVTGFTGHIPGYRFLVGGNRNRLSEVAYGKTFSKTTNP